MKYIMYGFPSELSVNRWVLNLVRPNFVMLVARTWFGKGPLPICLFDSGGQTAHLWIAR